jgi:hypothetical protein
VLFHLFEPLLTTKDDLTVDTGMPGDDDEYVRVLVQVRIFAHLKSDGSEAAAVCTLAQERDPLVRPRSLFDQVTQAIVRFVEPILVLGAPFFPARHASSNTRA